MDRRIRPWSRISAKSLKVQRQYLRHPNRRNCRHLGTSVVLYRVRRQVGSSAGTQHLFPLPIRRIKCCFTLRDFFLSTFFLYIFPCFALFSFGKYSITPGMRPTMINYLSMDFGTGVFIAPTILNAGTKFSEQFQKTCLTIHRLFQRTLKAKVSSSIIKLLKRI